MLSHGDYITVFSIESLTLNVIEINLSDWIIVYFDGNHNVRVRIVIAIMEDH